MKLLEYRKEVFYEDVHFPPVWQFISFGGRHYGKRIWRFDVLGFLFDKYYGLFSRLAWSQYAYPSYCTALKDAINNVLMFLTPWRRNSRILLENIINRNGTKLINCNRKSCCIRTRGNDTVYLFVDMGLVFGEVSIGKWIDNDGKGTNIFVSGVLSAFCGQDCSHLEFEHKTVVKWMPILTMKQCEKFMDVTVANTKGYIDWILD